MELIRVLAPDLLTEGGDYTIGSVVGADLVTAADGRVLTERVVENEPTPLAIAPSKI